MDSQGLILLCNLQISDWIDIANILITSVIGIWIGTIVQNNLTKGRYLKEYFINEIKDIRDLYKIFVNQLYTNSTSAVYTKDWFKIMSERIKNLDNLIKTNFKIDKIDLTSKHAEIQQNITAMDEFNEDYKKEVIKFSNQSKNEILKLHTELSYKLTEMVIEINSAKKRRKKKNKSK